MYNKSFEDGREYHRINGEISSEAYDFIWHAEKYKGKFLQRTHLLMKSYLAKLEKLGKKYCPGAAHTAICETGKGLIKSLEFRLKEQGLNPLKATRKGIVEDKK